MPNGNENSSPLSPEAANLDTLTDILSSAILARIAQSLSPQTSKHAKKKSIAARKTKDESKAIEPSTEKDNGVQPTTTKDTQDLADFTEYLATELFASLPLDLQRLPPEPDSTETEDDATRKLRTRYTVPLPSATLASLIKPISAELHSGIQACLPSTLPASQSTLLLEQVLEEFCETVAPAPTPISESTGATGKTVLKAPPRPDTGCELCARPWIPLTQHHLIPRSAAPKAVKRGWHTAEACQTSIAWLCRACHSFVHGFAGNDELAREWYSVELIEEREDVQRWVAWVGRVRWKAK